MRMNFKKEEDPKYQEIVLDDIPLTLFDSTPIEVKNPFSGESCVLCPEAIAMYDLIKGAEMLKDYEIFDKAMAAFIKRWPKEYMILLN